MVAAAVVGAMQGAPEGVVEVVMGSAMAGAMEEAANASTGAGVGAPPGRGTTSRTLPAPPTSESWSRDQGFCGALWLTHLIRQGSRLSPPHRSSWFFLSYFFLLGLSSFANKFHCRWEVGA